MVLEKPLTELGAGFPDSVVREGHLRCTVCGHLFTGPAVLDAHRNAFPPNHPLRRCLDVMEMQALDYVRRANGAWAAGMATQLYPSQARRLATVRQEWEHWDATGEVLPHERRVAGTRADQPALVPEVRPAPGAVLTAADPVTEARKREQARLRKRRQRGQDVTHPHQGTGSVTNASARPTSIRPARFSREPRP